VRKPWGKVAIRALTDKVILSVQIYETYQGIVTHPLFWIFVGLTALFYLVQGATRQKEKDWVSPETHIKAVAASLGLAGVPTLIFVVIGLTWLIVATTLLFGLYKLIWDMIWHAVPQGDDAVWSWRFSLAQIAALTTVLGAVIALPLTVNRLLLSRRQTETVEQGHITDRINKAVEGLGAEKTVKVHRKNNAGDLLFHGKEASNGKELDYKRPVIVELTEPNIEVRIGAIYALERLSQDSERDHIQIMEILCAYIRQNAGREHVALPKGKTMPKEWQEWRFWAHDGQEYPRLDVDVALKVIERRGAARKRLEKDQDPPSRLGFERAPLRKIILSERDLTDANLSNAELQGAYLELAELQGADLRGAQLQGAYLGDAKLQGAMLGFAELQGAMLGGAKLQKANLWHAKLQGADLGCAELQGADLRFTKFDGDTEFTAATLQGAAARFVNFWDIEQIKPHLEEMFGDDSVTLPGGHGPKHESWPKHWPKFELGHKQFDKEWKKWLADPEGYVPPEPPSREDAQG